MSPMKISQNSSKVSRFLRAPLKALTGVRDLYVRSMNSCAGHVTYAGGVYGCPAAHIAALPESFSGRSTRNDEDYRELLEAASADHNKVVPRSKSLAVARIEEDRVCEFRRSQSFFGRV